MTNLPAKRSTTDATEQKDEYSANDQRRIDDFRSRRRKQATPQLKDGKGEGLLIDDLLTHIYVAESFGGAPDAASCLLLNQAVRTISYNSATVADGNYTLALLHGIKARDELEGVLATQMVATHNLAMKFMALANHPEQTYEGIDANVMRATKLLRTFTAQIEALNKYRGGGQQKVTVEHVHVNEGGKAIVGTIERGGGKHENRG